MIVPTSRGFRPRPVVTRDDADNAIRWTEGERLNHLLVEACTRFADRDAVSIGDAVITYGELDRRANQAARHLIAQGLKPGGRVGLLFDKSVDTYVAMLAVLKAGAAYVPFDAAFPNERIRFIIDDAEIAMIVSTSGFARRLSSFDVGKVFVDSDKQEIDARSPEGFDVQVATDPVCYIIYTSGTTGNPKGVAIAHSSICNFVRVAAELYGYEPRDRVYQGMTIAFDFSIEETWVPLMAGSALVPGKPGQTLMGDELADFLRANRVSVLACCPTLLATIEEAVPQLRILLVGGEACPHNLVERWARPGLTILNSYGPTEATVTATLTELRPDKPITIGIPLPTYSIVILDPAEDKIAEAGQLGEIGIAGAGLALGYVNRSELTAKKFIPDFLGLESNPSRRIYRTGDLGCVNEEGEIEYHGRIDTQVKIRGYRIELNEIEAALLDLPQIAQAAVTTYELEPGSVEIVGYYAFKHDATLRCHEILQSLRARLPAYMVPAYMEELAAIPLTLSNKADYKRLPKPNSRCVASGTNFVPPKSDSERIIAQALANVLQVERISTEDHFFEDLGANSLLMARFASQIRKSSGMSNVSMRDIYLNPTIATLAAHLDSSIEGFIATRPEPFHIPSNRSYFTCGALQLGFYAAYALLILWMLEVGFTWAIAAEGLGELYGRAVVFAVASFVALTAVAVIAKWTLIGRFKPEPIPIWSFAYFRFWLVKTLMRGSPMAMFAGTPIYNAYLRMMGARVGRNVVINSGLTPVCADMFAIGDNSILRKDSVVLCYRAQSNFIHIGPVELGKNVFVGEASVIDIDTAMGDDTQLGHSSSLQSGQRVPDGKRFHGSPAVETNSDFCPIERTERGGLRSGLYSAFALVSLLLVAMPLPFLAVRLWNQYSDALGLSFSASWPSLLGTATALFFTALALGLASIYVVPRLCMLFLTPGRVYPMFGLHYLLQGIISRGSNSHFFCVLFGDSSFIVTYMRYVGWKLNTVLQTGSNMGTNQRHDNPFLCNIGSGTMVSDGLSMINTHTSATSFQLLESKIGENNYLGNDIFYPPNGRTGANCLLGTKTMIPVDGPFRENVGLLGSPAFEIPRMVDRDRDMNARFDEATRLARLRQKNAYNFVTAALFLASRWLVLIAAIVLWQAALGQYASLGLFALFAAAVVTIAGQLAFFITLERASLRFRRLEPKIVSIYDPYFWFHERHWKMSESPITGLFSGTPFRGMVYRALGMKVGRQVFDCSRTVTERTLTEVGDYANLNEGCVLQAHSLEEGVFKSDHIRLGKGCSIGPSAFVHYGVTLGDHVVLDADCFLMKGEVLDSHTSWRGNPAKLIRRAAHDAAVPAGENAAAAPCATDEYAPSIAAE